MLVGAGLLLVSTFGIVSSVLIPSVGWAIGVVVASAVCAGLGMGLAYPLLSSEPFSAGSSASTAGALIAFAETAGTAWAALVGGGLYSLAHVAGMSARSGLLVPFAALVAIALAAVGSVLLRRRA